jgi:hypothetical protein
MDRQTNSSISFRNIETRGENVSRRRFGSQKPPVLTRFALKALIARDSDRISGIKNRISGIKNPAACRSASDRILSRPICAWHFSASLPQLEFTFEMSGVVTADTAWGSFTQEKYKNFIIGTLVIEGVHTAFCVTEELLNKYAKRLRQAFSRVFGEVWSFVIYKDSLECHGLLDGWIQIKLGDRWYFVLGCRYTGVEPDTVWSNRFNTYFNKEFACQQWVIECEPVCTSVSLKYKDQFSMPVNVMVLRGGTVGGDVVGKSFAHSGHSVWVIAS